MPCHSATLVDPMAPLPLSDQLCPMQVLRMKVL